MDVFAKILELRDRRAWASSCRQSLGIVFLGLLITVIVLMAEKSPPAAVLLWLPIGVFGFAVLIVSLCDGEVRRTKAPAPAAPRAAAPTAPKAAPAPAAPAQAPKQAAAKPSPTPTIKGNTILPEETALESGKGDWTYVAAPVKPKTLAAARAGKPDDLKQIKGVGPKLEAMLHGIGFYHFDQIAGWTAAEIAWVDENLEGFKGRVTRDDWVAQAKVLAAGGQTAFSKKVEDGGVH